MNFKTVDQLSLNGKRGLIRVDFNVPLNEQLQIQDDFRILQSIPTIQYLLEKKASVVLLSHMGRPQGQKDSKFSTKVCRQRLSELLKKEVQFVDGCIENDVQKAKKELNPSGVLLLENIRFYPEETTSPNDRFAKLLAQNIDFYINDAFSCSHRKQVSVVDVPLLFSEEKAAGFLLNKEVEMFKRYVLNPRDPLFAIVGGAKISTKIGILKCLLKKVKVLLVGGAMANTFLKAKGYNLANSLSEDNYLDEALEIVKFCEKQRIELILPTDLIFTDQLTSQGAVEVIELGQKIPKNCMAVDIGPETIKNFVKILREGKIIFWNGPLGVFEMDAFAHGTQQIALALSKLNATKVIGGGDSAAAVSQLGLQSCFDHISTGGGASLELIEKGSLPGIDALSLK